MSVGAVGEVLCQWAVPGPQKVCTRRASVWLAASRPCGCRVQNPTPTCPGHAEAWGGGDAPKVSTCRVCGARNRVRLTLAPNRG